MFRDCHHLILAIVLLGLICGIKVVYLEHILGTNDTCIAKMILHGVRNSENGATFLFLNCNLWRYNSYTIYLFKCTIQWFLVYSQFASITIINFRTFFITLKRNPIPISSHSPCPPPLPIPRQPPISFWSL